VYSREFSAKEIEEREKFERSLTRDLGGTKATTTAQRALIRSAGFIELRLRRTYRAAMEGRGEIPDEHLLSWVNAQRLLLCALGLEKRLKPEMNIQTYMAKRARQAESHRAEPAVIAIKEEAATPSNPEEES
jgi:hypothetical protein